MSQGDRDGCSQEHSETTERSAEKESTPGIEHPRSIRFQPPIEPKAAAFDSVVMLARRMLFKEIEREKRESIRKKRWKGVLDEFDRRISLIVREVSHCIDRNDQFEGEIRALELIEFDGISAASIREDDEWEDWLLLVKYEAQLPIVQRIMGSKDDRRAGLDSYEEIALNLKREYPFLTRNQVTDALHDTPSWAVCVILGSRIPLSPDRVKGPVDGPLGLSGET